MSKNAVANNLKNQLKIIGSFVASFWAIEIVDRMVFRGGLDQLGIVPRNFVGLRGILFAPFLHGGFPHLIANTVPFIVLGWLVTLQEISDLFIVTLSTMLVGGLGVWLFGDLGTLPGVHVGSSILIFGYLGFLLLRGYFQRNIPSILLSIVVFFFYGSLVWGVLPSERGISWEGHLFGFLGGVLAAYAIAKEKRVYRD